MQKLLQVFDKCFKYIIASILVIVPLFPKFPFIRIPGTYVSIRFEDFLMAFLFLMVIVKVSTNLRQFLNQRFVKIIILFLSVGLVSAISAIFLTKTAGLTIGFLHLFRRLEYLVPFLAILAFYPNEKAKNIEFYIKTLMITVFITFLYGLGQKYLFLPVIITQNEEYAKGIALRWTPGSHINSTFAGHYDLATFLVLLMPIFISLFFIYKDKITKSALFIVILCGLWLLASSASRISVVSYLVGASFSLVLLKKYKEVLLVILSGVILLGLSSNLYSRYQRIIDVLLEVKAAEETIPTPIPTPTQAPEVFEDRSTSIRLNVEWPRAIRSIFKNPLLGTGYSSVGLATDNDYLRSLAETGIIGFFAFGLIFIQFFLIAKNSLPLISNFSGLDLGFVAGAYGGIIGVLLNAVFIDVFEASKFAVIFWLVFGITVCMVKDKIYAQKN